MIDIPITRVQLLAPPEVRETRDCWDCAFWYCVDGGFIVDCLLGRDYKNYPPCKYNFTPEEMKIILDDVLDLELYFRSYSNGIEYITVAGVND
jgi:hypothetical protein